MKTSLLLVLVLVGPVNAFPHKKEPIDKLIDIVDQETVLIDALNRKIDFVQKNVMTVNERVSVIQTHILTHQEICPGGWEKSSFYLMSTFGATFVEVCKDNGLLRIKK